MMSWALSSPIEIQFLAQKRINSNGPRNEPHLSSVLICTCFHTNFLQISYIIGDDSRMKEMT